ncbi:MAG: SUMF1/EgtB/PvdO family nonheme iron enzyme [Caldilineaceae bacterium]
MKSHIWRFMAVIGAPFLLLVLLCLLLSTPAVVFAQRSIATPTPAAEAPTAAPTSTPSAPASTSTPTTSVETVAPLGYLRFSHNASSGSGDFHLVLDSLPPAAEGSFYVLWLLSPQTDTLALGAFTAPAGSVDLTGTTALNLAGRYNEARITLEVAARENSDLDTALSMSDRAVLSASRSPDAIDLLNPILLFELNGGAATSAGSTEGEEDADAAIVGALTGAETQMQIAVRHTGFLRDALSETDLPGARRHSEHINNILDGESGFSFADLDRNGLAENPGDGVGVRVYLAAVRQSLEELAELPDGPERFRALAPNAEDISLDTMLQKIDEDQVLVDDIFNKIIQIFSSDTVTEANGFALELRVLVDTLNANVNQANDDMLQLASYTFYGPPATFDLPPQVIQRATAITPTAGITATATNTTAVAVATTPTATARSLATPARRTTATRAATATSNPTATATRRSVAIATATASPTAQALPTVESSAFQNPQPGDRWLNPADGAVYIYVPGGTFQMGSTAAEAVSPREEPQHEVTVDGFWMQQTEVTNAQYGRCVAAGACEAPTNARWNDPAYANHPATDVTWAQAVAYAQWAGGRLPSEAEWERACRGNDGRTYPWGNDAASSALANFDSNIGDTTPVGSYPAGQSAYGLLDLGGNVWEWTNSLTAAYPYVADDGREAPPDVRNAKGERTARGGSIYYTHHHIRCAARSGFAPTTASQYIGLRIVL